MTTAARVVVLTRTGCHLCDDAIEICASVCAASGVSWATIDVDTDPALRTKYTDHVPVTLVDGRVVARWFLDPEQLGAALRCSS